MRKRKQWNLTGWCTSIYKLITNLHEFFILTCLLDQLLVRGESRDFLLLQQRLQLGRLLRVTLCQNVQFAVCSGEFTRKYPNSRVFHKLRHRFWNFLSRIEVVLLMQCLTSRYIILDFLFRIFSYDYDLSRPS